MAVTNVSLESLTQAVAKPHQVFLRAKWNQEWVRIPFLFVEEVAWRLAPALGTANLIWRYGRGARQGELTPKVIARMTDKRRQFVKVIVDTNDDEALAWFGTVEIDGRQAEGLTDTQGLFGTSSLAETGEQALFAFDLAYSLFRTPIRGASWKDADGSEQRAGRPFVFNKPNAAGQPQGNRSSAQGLKAYLFSGLVGGEDALWTSRTIAEYLCGYECPKGKNGIAQWSMALEPSSADILPDWDKPVIDPHGQTVGDLLNQLMPRSRMLSWRLFIDDDDAVSPTVYVMPISLTGSDISTQLGTFKKAKRQLALQTTIAGDRSPGIMYSLAESEIPTIDQARVCGALRTTTCTLSDADGDAVAGWTSTLETSYEAGFSGAAGYGAMDVDGKQAANAEIRESDKLFPVFRRIAVAGNWDQKVQDGLGAGEKKAAFLKDDLTTTLLKRVNPRELTLAPTLPLAEGYDYTGLQGPEGSAAAVRVDDGPHGRLAALVLFKDPVTGTYVQAEKIGAAAGTIEADPTQNRRLSVRVEVPAGDRAVLLHVEGQPQHAIAYSDFTPLAVDEAVGEWDWRDALFTVCIYDDRFAEGVYPKDANVSATVPLLRELVVYPGENYRQDYIAPGTVVGVDLATRGLLRCAAGGWANDDRQQLQARARQIYEYYAATRRTLILETELITAEIFHGDYIVSVGRRASWAWIALGVAAPPLDVGTVVSEMVLTIPGGENPPPPKMRYVTAFAELDKFELTVKKGASA